MLLLTLILPGLYSLVHAPNSVPGPGPTTARVWSGVSDQTYSIPLYHLHMTKAINDTNLKYSSLYKFILTTDFTSQLVRKYEDNLIEVPYS